jgi:hypothetical protein
VNGAVVVQPPLSLHPGMIIAGDTDAVSGWSLAANVFAVNVKRPS